MDTKQLFSALGYFGIRAITKVRNFDNQSIGDIHGVKFITQVTPYLSRIRHILWTYAKYFTLVEESGLLELTAEETIPATPFPGPLTGKKYKLPYKAIGWNQTFVPMYINDEPYLLDIASPDTIFTGPLPYLKLPHCVETQWFILNNNLHIAFEAPSDIISVEYWMFMLKRASETKDSDIKFGPTEYDESLFIVRGSMPLIPQIYKMIHDLYIYLSSLSYTCLDPWSRIYIVGLLVGEPRLLMLPHGWERICTTRTDSITLDKLYELVQELGEYSPQVLAPPDLMSNIEIEEYKLLDIDISYREQKRLVDIMTQIVDKDTKNPALFLRLIDMIMCIASRGFSDELVLEPGETHSRMVIRVFKNHLDYLPYVRTPTGMELEVYKGGANSVAMKTYHSTRNKMNKTIQGQGSLEHAVDTLLWLTTGPIPEDVKQLFDIPDTQWHSIPRNYDVIEPNRELSRDVFIKYLKDPNSPANIPKDNLGSVNMYMNEGELEAEIKTYTPLPHKFYYINGVEFSQSDINIFRNTLIYDTFLLSGNDRLDYHLITLADLKLFKRFLSGMIMVKQLYDGLSESGFKILSSDLSFLRYTEIIQVRNFIDTCFNLGTRFMTQIEPTEDQNGVIRQAETEPERALYALLK